MSVPLGLMPGIAVLRGKVDPTLPQQLGVFAVAGLEKACQELAAREVGAAYSTSSRAASLARMVEELAGLAPVHDRYQQFVDALTDHVDEVIADTGDVQIAMESAYVLACSSPDAAAVGL